jgi:hypothetical protein
MVFSRVESPDVRKNGKSKAQASEAQPHTGAGGLAIPAADVEIHALEQAGVKKMGFIAGPPGR